MALYGVELQQGVKLEGPVTVLAAAGIANSAAIFQYSNLATQVGTKTMRLLKVWGLNAAGIDTLLHIGTGLGALAFVDIIPPILTMNGLGFEQDVMIPVEVAQDITAYPVAATVTVQVQVLEIG